MKSTATSIAVIGGGITGVTTAYALAKRGFAVTLFERHRYAAMETSFANGGQLSASNAEVAPLAACWSTDGSCASDISSARGASRES